MAINDGRTISNNDQFLSILPDINFTQHTIFVLFFISKWPDIGGETDISSTLDCSPRFNSYRNIFVSSPSANPQKKLPTLLSSKWERTLSFIICPGVSPRKHASQIRIPSLGSLSSINVFASDTTKLAFFISRTGQQFSQLHVAQPLQWWRVVIGPKAALHDLQVKLSSFNSHKGPKEKREIFAR